MEKLKIQGSWTEKHNKQQGNQDSSLKDDLSDENKNKVCKYKFFVFRPLKTIFDGFLMGFTTKDDDEN